MLLRLNNVSIYCCIGILDRNNYVDTHQGCTNVSTPYVVMFYGAVMNRSGRKINFEASHLCM